MKYFSMWGKMDEDMLRSFVDFSNAHANSMDKWRILLNTSGGSFFVTESIAKIISDRQNVEIVVQGAYSSGFMLLHLAKCRLLLSKGVRGMWHYGKWSIDLNDKGKPYYHDDAAIMSNLPIFRKLSEQIAKKSMTAAELKKFRADQDVYFSPQRMKQIFPEAIILK